MPQYPFFIRELASCNLHRSSLSWAELYLALAALVQRFTFDFIRARAEEFECDSYQFVIGARIEGVLKAWVSLRQAEMQIVG